MNLMPSREFTTARLTLTESMGRRPSRGLSLVELMVALAIGLLLLLGLVEIFGASRAAFSSAEGSARIQENSRFALEFLRRDARMAGHMGCLNELGYQAMPDLMFNHNAVGVATALTSAEWAMRIDMPLEAYDYNGTAPAATYVLSDVEAADGAADWTPALPASLLGVSTEAIKGSDVLVLRYLSAESVGLDGLGVNVDGAGGSATVDAMTTDPAWTALSPFVEAERMYAVTNCQRLSLFQATTGADAAGMFNSQNSGLNVSGWTGNEVYGSSGSRLYRYEVAVFYVALDVGGQPALFVRRFQTDGANRLSDRAALVDGVESMQLVFGRDTSNAIAAGGRDDYADSYGAASDVAAGAMDATAWQNVISMRIGLLVRSPSQASAVEGAAPIPLRVADTVITPPDDLRLRSAYESMVAVRNRVRN